MAADTDTLGPITYLIVEFPDNRMTGDGFAKLVDLVDRGLIRVLDLEFVLRDADGSVRRIELRDIDNDGRLDLSLFEGAAAGLLDDGDRADAASVIKPGSSAAVLIFENSWATSFTQTLRGSGGELVAAGYIPQDVFSASLDESGL